MPAARFFRTLDMSPFSFLLNKKYICGFPRLKNKIVHILNKKITIIPKKGVKPVNQSAKVPNYRYPSLKPLCTTHCVHYYYKLHQGCCRFFRRLPSHLESFDQYLGRFLTKYVEYRYNSTRNQALRAWFQNSRYGGILIPNRKSK